MIKCIAKMTFAKCLDFLGMPADFRGNTLGDSQL